MTEEWCNGVHAGVCVYVHRGEREYLMIKRKGAHGAGTWSVPGGWIDPGETPAEAAERELAEEIGGVVIGNVELVGITHDEFPHGPYCITFHYKARALDEAVEGTINEPDKIEEISWRSFLLANMNLPDPLFLPVANLLLGDTLNIGPSGL